MADNGKQGGRGVWPSLEIASQVSDIANIVFIASLVLGVCSTVAIVWMAGVKEAHWDTSREQSREKVAALELVAANANKTAAEANERTAAAELKLNETRREVGRREFDKDKFIKRLENIAKRPIKILHAADDPDAFVLAQFEIALPLVGSGWQVYGGNEQIPPDIAQCAPFGDVSVAVKSITQEDAQDFEKPPSERKSTPWAIADAINQGLLSSRGVGVVTCPFIKDDLLYILVSKKYIFFPKEQTKP